MSSPEPPENHVDFSPPIEGIEALCPIADVRLPHSTYSGVSPLPLPRARHDAVVNDNAEPAPTDFQRVYLGYFQRVSHWVRAFGGLDADIDDLTQEVFLVVQRKLDSFAGPSMAAWLYGIARKTVSDHRRRAWLRRWLRSSDVDELETRATHGDPAESLERREARRLVATILNEMSAVRRSTFVLFEIEGYSGEEIAELEQVPVNTVYTRLHHARKDFFRLMAAHQARDTGGQP
jgi:RNA polymerase sigma-70 factor (ECF subfamily)